MQRRTRQVCIVAAVLLLLGIVLPVFPGSASLYHAFESNLNTGGGNVRIDNTPRRAAQSFTASTDYTLTRVTLSVEDQGADDSLTVQIVRDASGLPSSNPADILAGGINNSGNFFNWVNYDLTPPVNLVGGTVYWIVAIDNLNGNNQGYRWERSGADVYPDGRAATYQGGTWTLQTYDLTFQNFGYRDANITIGKVANRSKAQSGDLVQYTLYLNNTGTELAQTVWIDDILPPEVTYVSDSSATEGGVKTGDYNWTFTNVAAGTHFFVINVSVNPGIASGTFVTNTAFLDYTGFLGVPRPGSSASATILVNLRLKTLYLRDDNTFNPADRNDYLRTEAPTSSNITDFDTNTLPGVSIRRGQSHNWTQDPPLADTFHFLGDTYVEIYADNNGVALGETIKVSLYSYDGFSYVEIASVTETKAFDAISATTGPAGWQLFRFSLPNLNVFTYRNERIVLRVEVDSSTPSLQLWFAYDSTAARSRVQMETNTFIEITFLVTYDLKGLSSTFSFGETVTIRANVSDPLGSGDIASVTINVTDPDGVKVVNAQNMVTEATDPRSPSLWKLFRYSYLVPDPTKEGIYAAEITAYESNGVFDVEQVTFSVTSASIAIRKLSNVSSARQGDPVQFTLFFNNTGTSKASRVWINDSLPQGMVYINDSSAREGGTRTGNYNWSLSDVLPGSHYFVVNVTIASSGLTGASLLENRATLDYLDSKGYKRPASQDSAPVIVNGPRIYVKIRADKAFVGRLDVARYTLYFNNSGNEEALAVWIRMTVPSGLLYSNDSAAQTGLLSSRFLGSGDILFNFTNVPVGDHSFLVNFTIASRTPGNAQFFTQAFLNYSDTKGLLYPPSSDGALSTLVSPKIMLTKIAVEKEADPGDIVHYLLYYNNTGLALEEAKDLWINDTIDANTEYLSSYPVGSFDFQSGVVRWRFSSVPANFAGLVYLNLTVKPGLDPFSIIENRASAEYTDAVGNRMPRVESNASVAVTAPLIIAKQAVDRQYVESDDQVRYAIFYNNTGNGIARDLWINDTIDGNLQYLTHLGGGDLSINGNSLSWYFKDVTPGSHQLTLVLKAKVIFDDRTTITNVASIEYSDANRNRRPSVETNQVSMVTKAPKLAVQLTLERENAGPGDVMNFTVVIANSGSAMAKHVWLNDTLDDNLAYLGTDAEVAPDVNMNRYSWHFMDLAAGNSKSFKVTVQVKVSSTSGTLISNFVVLEHTDGKGLGSVRMNSNTVVFKVEVPPPPPGIAVELLVLPPVAVVLALVPTVFYVQRMRGATEDVFVLLKDGTLIAQVSKEVPVERRKKGALDVVAVILDYIMENKDWRLGGELRKVDFGVFKAAISRGNEFFLATAYTIRTPKSLDERMKRATSMLEEKFGSVFQAWDGDLQKISNLKSMLQDTMMPEASGSKPIEK